MQIVNLQQGSTEWHKLRKTKITATDAPIIMGSNPWKNTLQLYQEKLSDEVTFLTSERAKRGIDLEPIARDLFNIKTGFDMKPSIAVKDWMMASLDGRDDSSGSILEIKCPGEKDHAQAVSGKIPEHYYPQLQHQMYVCGVKIVYYFSFDGIDGVIVDVKRDDDYIHTMITKELEFYECLQNKIPPKDSRPQYIENQDYEWEHYASKWKNLTSCIKELEKQEEDIRQNLIRLGGGYNVKGAGISLCQVERKGTVDYSKIPELKGVDLEMYRKPSITSWRIT